MQQKTQTHTLGSNNSYATKKQPKTIPRTKHTPNALLWTSSKCTKGHCVYWDRI